MTISSTASPGSAVVGLAALLAELNAVMGRHDAATGFALMFAPRGVQLPDGYVLVQQYKPQTGVIELVPTRLEECDPTDILHETQTIDLGDGELIRLVARPGRTHGCTVGIHDAATDGPAGRVHTHQPR